MVTDLAGFYIVSVDVDECDDTAEKYGMDGTLPTLIYMNTAEENPEIARQPGAKDLETLKGHIKEHFGIPK